MILLINLLVFGISQFSILTIFLSFVFYVQRSNGFVVLLNFCLDSLNLLITHKLWTLAMEHLNLKYLIFRRNIHKCSFMQWQKVNQLVFCLLYSCYHIISDIYSWEKTKRIVINCNILQWYISHVKLWTENRFLCKSA